MTRLGLCGRLFLTSFLLQPWAELRADGGTVRLSERKGDYCITVFTSPTPVRAGPVDVSVLVQDAASGEPVPQARVQVWLTPREQPEAAIRQPVTAEAATNKLFKAAVFDLPRAGLWDVDIAVEGLREPLEARFVLEADEPLPRLGELWAWIAWPALAVVLFLTHHWLVRRSCSCQSSAASSGVSSSSQAGRLNVWSGSSRGSS